MSDAEKAQAFKKYRRRKGIPFSCEAFREYLAYWEDFLDLSFAGEGAGILQIRDEFISECTMSMPHLVPVTAYKSTLDNLTNIASRESGRFDDEIVYFIRTRVMLDENSEIVSANHAEI